MLKKSEEEATLNVRKDLIQAPKPIREIEDIELSDKAKKELMKIYKQNKHQPNIQNQQQLFTHKDESHFKTETFTQKSHDLFSALDQADQNLKMEHQKRKQIEGEQMMFQLDEEEIRLEKQKIQEYYQSENDKKLITYNNQNFTEYSLKDVEYDEKSSMQNAFAFLKDLEKRKKQEKFQKMQDEKAGKMVDEDEDEEESVSQNNQQNEDLDKLEEELDQKINFKPKYNKNIRKDKIKNEEKQSQIQALKNKTQLLSIDDEEDEECIF